MIRKVLFWLHLGAGIVAGLVIAIMSFTGVAIAFEKELVAWSERDARRVELPQTASTPLPVDQLVQRLRAENPMARPTSITLSADPADAVAIAVGRDDVYYANPYNGEIRKPASTRMHDFMHVMTAWHRWLGREGDSRPIGKAINGACNAAFFVLAATGLYLWWPRTWSRRGVKAVAILNLRLAGKARDFNWHNAIGLWTAPVLIVLTLTALPISYRWASNLVYRVTGNEPPAQGAGPGAGGPAVAIAAPSPDTSPASYNDLFESVRANTPTWETITLRLNTARSGAPSPRAENAGSRTAVAERSSTPSETPRSDTSNRRRSERDESGAAGTPQLQAITAVVRTADQWPLFSSTTLTLDPFSADVLRSDGFADQNGGRRLRSWTRFLHTGEAFGAVGKLVAALASFGALFLVWTGFALSWRRFFGRRATVVPPTPRPATDHPTA